MGVGWIVSRFSLKGMVKKLVRTCGGVVVVVVIEGMAGAISSSSDDFEVAVSESSAIGEGIAWEFGQVAEGLGELRVGSAGGVVVDELIGVVGVL